MDFIRVWIWKNARALRNWGLWSIISLSLLGTSAYALFDENTGRSVYFLPGASSAGHYQIEQRCSLCHEAFGDVKQRACLDCHQAELQQAKDSHKIGIFRDPRNADKLDVIDATRCVTCHKEHRPAITENTGVTLPRDFCITCHKGVAKERPTHEGLDFQGCSACHNYHDNRALYEDFLMKHAGEPELAEEPLVRERNFAELYRTANPTRHPLRKTEAHYPANIPREKAVLNQWAAGHHAQSGINCGDCHLRMNTWTLSPPLGQCGECHEDENAGFLAGRHGMRLQQPGLTAMRPADARLPMKPANAGKPLTCNSCHEAHNDDTNSAAVEACLGCHDDQHSKAYKNSGHYRAWQQEREGTAKPGSGVSCATCHLPRRVKRRDGKDAIIVQHNQNDNLRPNQKMIRDVCLACHGLAFSLDALADNKLIAGNFAGKPRVHLESIEMAKRNKARKSIH